MWKVLEAGGLETATQGSETQLWLQPKILAHNGEVWAYRKVWGVISDSHNYEVGVHGKNSKLFREGTSGKQSLASDLRRRGELEGGGSDETLKTDNPELRVI